MCWSPKTIDPRSSCSLKVGCRSDHHREAHAGGCLAVVTHTEKARQEPTLQAKAGAAGLIV